MDCVGDLFSRISVVVDERVVETVDERIDELTNMTCIDCKYFNPNIRIKPEWVNQGLCEKRLTNGYAEYPTFDCEICGMFKPKDDCWESVSK